MANSDNTLETMNLQLIGAEKEEQLIIFNVGDEEFGLDVLRVQEIIRYIKPTKIPHTPTFVEGVIDFRGEVIPVFNMRQRFGIEDLIGESVRRVDRGNIMIKKSDDMLKRIVENTKKTSDVIVEVASAMREQSSAAEQIQSSIEQLNQVTQENAAMVEEISATSEELDAEAESLLDNVAQFKVEEKEASGRKKGEPRNSHGSPSKGTTARNFGLAKGKGAENFNQDSLDRF